MSAPELPREEIACAGRLLGTHHAERNIILDRGTARLQRDGAHALARAGGPRAPSLAHPAGSARLRNGTDGATAAVASVPRNKQQHSTSHHFPAIASLHSAFFLQTQVACFFRCASCQLGHRLSTFGCTQLTERGPSSVPKCRVRTNSTGNGSGPPSQQPQPPDAAVRAGQSSRRRQRVRATSALTRQVPVTAAPSRPGDPFCSPAVSHWPR